MFTPSCETIILPDSAPPSLKIPQHPRLSSVSARNSNWCPEQLGWSNHILQLGMRPSAFRMLWRTHQIGREHVFWIWNHPFLKFEHVSKYFANIKPPTFSRVDDYLDAYTHLSLGEPSAWSPSWILSFQQPVPAYVWMLPLKTEQMLGHSSPLFPNDEKVPAS